MMNPNPRMLCAAGPWWQQELRGLVARQRRALAVVAPTLPWRKLAIRVLAFVVLCPGVRG
jgi:hypothetical protein